MSIKRNNLLFKILCCSGVVLALNACSSEPEAWTKSQSPWDQRRDGEVQAPAPEVESYKADLEMPVEPAGEVELSYQAEPVESFTPDAEMEPAGVAVSTAMDESVPGGSIMDQPANYYTMQLMASVDIDRVIRFADQNQVAAQFIVATERDGVIWHVLLMDVYPDYASALAARDRIAPSLKNEPWIRRVGSVQKLVR